jgi:hypothetical protein
MDFAMTRSTPWSPYPVGVVAFLFGRTGQLVPVRLGHAPILIGPPQMLSHHLSEPHYRWHPLWEWLGQPAMSMPFLLGCLMLTAALGPAALPRSAARRPDARARLTLYLGVSGS